MKRQYPMWMVTTICLLAFFSIRLEGDASAMSIASADAVFGNAFTYQGVLRNNAGAINANCDFVFDLYASASGGAALDGRPKNNVAVQNGVFVVELDFGGLAFNGDARWLAVEVRCPTSVGSYTTLSPRQRLHPSPYALVAAKADASNGDFSVEKNLAVNGTGTFGRPGLTTALSLHSPDLWINADPSFGRGDGGRALSHAPNDMLVINMEQDFAGGVVINGLRRTEIGHPGDVVAATFRSPDLYMAADKSFGRGNGGRALVHNVGNVLEINYENDFSGGVTVGGNTIITGGLSLSNSLLVGGDTIMFTDNNLPGGLLWLNSAAALGRANGDGGFSVDAKAGDLVMRADSGKRIILGRGVSVPDHPAALTVAASGLVSIPNLQGGGFVEANLQRPEEVEADVIERFSQGDVLCWDSLARQLEKCNEAASPLVVAVADANGKPLIMGVEPVKVIGPIVPGDLLVASTEPGYAVSWTAVSSETIPAGTVIAKALEPLDEGSGTILSMILAR